MTLRGKDIWPWLEEHHACDDAKIWVDHNRTLTICQLWKKCERGDWMLWLGEETKVNEKTFALAMCDCAEPVLAHVPEGEDRPQIAIETKRAWARGEATAKDVLLADTDAFTLNTAASLAAGAYSTAAAGFTAKAAYEYCLGGVDAKVKARTESLRRSAYMVRRHISWEDLDFGIERKK